MLSNFNQCRIAGRVFVELDHDADEAKQDHGHRGAKERTGDEKVVVERDFRFPSAEHYWWAHFTKELDDVERLAVGGDLSTLESGLCLMLGREKGIQKARYWSKKDSVGIVAKMAAANKKSSGQIRCRAGELGMKMGLHPLEQYGAQGEMSTLESIWNKIQMDKFGQNSEHRASLLSTGSEVLVEFVRMKPEGHMWGGQVRGGIKRSKGLIEGGEMVGRNFTGECLMAVRASMA